MSTNHDSVYSEEEIRNIEAEFERLQGKTYLDHAGATLYAKSQISSIADDLSKNLYSNPHTSKQTTDAIDLVRYKILNHFKTDSTHHDLIFTSGSTAALKLAAETFQFTDAPDKNGGLFMYLEDNHTSVLGLREIAEIKSAEVLSINKNDLEKSIQSDVDTDKSNYAEGERVMFVYPAQCNFSGYKYPLKWIELIQNGVLNNYVEKKSKKRYREWIVFLDTATYVSTNDLNLSTTHPDLICLSFYKIFGYPTGIGALIVKKSSSKYLNSKRYYGGGTVEIAMSDKNYHVKRKQLHIRLEDGTISFLNILSLKQGFEILEKLIPRGSSLMKIISQHTFSLAKTLYEELKLLQHYNSKPVVKFYSDTDYNDISRQGGIVSFNVLRSNGQYIGFAEVIHMAELFNIMLRSGCFCNPGACRRHLNLTSDDVKKQHEAGHVCGDQNDLVNGIPTGAVRASFGYMSTIKDVFSLINMIKKCFLEESPSVIDYKSININMTEPIENTAGVLKEINIYPIKSCGPFTVNTEWYISETGLLFDREWMIITDSGTALTQKQNTKMCLITPEINLSIDKMTLKYPGFDDVEIPLKIINETELSSALCNSKVCNDQIKGYDCGDEIADWISQALEISGLRLIRQISVRNTKKKNEMKISQISLSNAAQYLIVNTSSVSWLANKVTEYDFTNNMVNLVKRFRGNLIVESGKEFNEFQWKAFSIGDIKFKVEGPCTRCQMVCIDQETGEKTVEPLRTISKEFQGKINFGIYASHQFTIEDAKAVLKCGNHLKLT